MNPFKAIALIVVLTTVSPAFGETSNEAAKEIVTEQEVRQALRILIRAGVLGVKDSELIVKNPSIFDQLERQGHVESGGNHTSAICIKE
jgi:hypothetical protein